MALVQRRQRGRALIQEQAFEARWGPIKPKLIRWTEAVEKYEAAKAGKDTLAWDKKRLAWWGEFLAAQGVHYVQAISPDATPATPRRPDRLHPLLTHSAAYPRSERSARGARCVTRGLLGSHGRRITDIPIQELDLSQ